MLLALFYESKLSLIKYLLSMNIIILPSIINIQPPTTILLSFVHYFLYPMHASVELEG